MSVPKPFPVTLYYNVYVFARKLVLHCNTLEIYKKGDLYTNLPKSISFFSLIGHNNPINGFRLAATHLSRRLGFLCAYDTWSHQSMTGLPRFGPSNGYKVVLFFDFRRCPHQIPVSPEYHSPSERYGRASAAALY